MKKKLIATMLLAGSALFAETHFSIGVGVGAPAYYPPAPPVVVARPPMPGPGYTWVDGYRNNGVWMNGYWAPPVVVAPRAHYVAPRYRRDWNHDRRSDHDRGRDYDRGHDFRR
ncbi:MAG TPA: hypothetical protein VGF16_05510 [Bryobacteraceae bacterium]|jgi:hypothetical protein